MTAASANSSASSPASLSPSSAGGSASSVLLAPPTLPTMKPKKKPGPKPKPRVALSRLVKLKIDPSHLATFKLPTSFTSGTPRNSSPSRVSPQPSAPSPGNGDVYLVPPTQKRRGIPGPKPGTKRVRQAATLMGKPGRKKTKMDLSSPGGALMNGVSHGTHGKPGPKANTGAINAQLRALDRSGKPCKRWTKTGFTLKSFTGVEWSIPTWAAPVSHAVTDASPSENTGTASAEPSLGADTPPEIRAMPDLNDSIPGISEHTISEGIVAQ